MLAGCRHTGSWLRQLIHTGPERRPLGRLPLASPAPLECKEEGLAPVKQYFFCSLLNKQNSIRKEETQGQPNSARGEKPCKKAASRDSGWDGWSLVAPLPFFLFTFLAFPFFPPYHTVCTQESKQWEGTHDSKQFPPLLTYPCSSEARQPANETYPRLLLQTLRREGY